MYFHSNGIFLWPAYKSLCVLGVRASVPVNVLRIWIRYERWRNVRKPLPQAEFMNKTNIMIKIINNEYLLQDYTISFRCSVLFCYTW